MGHTSIVFLLLTLSLYPVLMQSPGLCSSYKSLKNTDTDYNSNKCFKLGVKVDGFRQTDGGSLINLENVDTAYLSVMLNTEIYRCSSYFVDQIDLIVTAYNGTTKTHSRQIGEFDLENVFAQPDNPSDFRCPNKFPIGPNSTKGPVTSTLLNCPNTTNLIYNNGAELLNILSMKFPTLSYQPNELWAYWFSNTTKIPDAFFPKLLTLDFIAEITYKNKNSTSKETRRKMEGLMGLRYVFPFSPIGTGCERITPPGPNGALIPYKTTYSVEPNENLCRCLTFSPPLPPEGSPAGFGYKDDLSKCLVFSFTLKTFSAIAYIDEGICPNDVVTKIQIEEVIFAAYNDKGFPYGKWEPVVDFKFMSSTMPQQMESNNAFWRKEKCFYSIQRETKPKPTEKLFYKNGFGVSASSTIDKYPDFLRLRQRPQNNQIFKGSFTPIEVGNIPVPTYIPKNVQIHAYFLLSGEITEDSGNILFRQFISKHEDYTIRIVRNKPVELVKLTRPQVKHQQLNEEYFDELNIIFKKDKGVDIVEQSIYTCSNSEPRQDQLCNCFSRTRGNLAVRELEDLVTENPTGWLQNNTDIRCFDLQAEFRGNEATVVFRLRCPYTLEVLETVIQALSQNGLPLATNWESINLGNVPNDPDQWKTRTCRKLAGVTGSDQDAMVRDTWEPVRDVCKVVQNPELRSQQQMPTGNRPAYIFISNRPLAGSKKGSEDIKDKTIAFCAFFEWKPDKMNAVRRRRFEFQFMAQAVVQSDFREIPPKNTIVTIRSKRYVMEPSINLLPNKILPPDEAPSVPNIRTTEIDLNFEYYNEIMFQPDKNCIKNPPAFDEFHDELCTCFFDHPGRGRPDPKEKDLLLGFQVQTKLTTAYAGEKWKVVVKISFDTNLNQEYGAFDFVIEALTPLDNDVQLGLPVGKWADRIYVGTDPQCTRDNVKDAMSHSWDCVVESNRALFMRASGHTTANPPSIFHFMNPFLDDFHYLCMEWEFIPPGNLVDDTTDQYFQFYAQILFEKRPKMNEKRFPKYHSTPVHSFENIQFLPGGLGIKHVSKAPHIHDDDFRVRLHTSYMASERNVDCPIDDIEKLSELVLPKLPPFDTTACTRFHSFEFVKRFDLDEPPTSPTEDYSDCFTLDAFPLKLSSNLHVRFRQFDKVSGGSKCEKLKPSEILVQALDQEGNPVGFSDNSFSIYEKTTHVHGDENDRCFDEDILKNYLDFSYREGHKCTKYDRVRNYAEGVAFTNQVKYNPTVFHAAFDNVEKPFGGTCFTWEFNNAEYRRLLGITFIKQVQFIAELFVPESRGDREGKVFIVRSPKYSYTGRKNLAEIPKCHDETLLSPGASSWVKLEKPPDIANYNILINEDQYRACLRFRDVRGCSDDTHSPTPKPVTNPTIFLNRTLRPPLKTTPSPNGLVPEKIFHGCLTTKVCCELNEPMVEFGESTCMERVDCKYVIAYGRTEDEDHDEDEVVMELYAHTKGWIAVGLSHDKKMGMDYVVECVREKNTSKNTGKKDAPNVYHSWNDLKYNNRRLMNTSANIRVKETIQSEAAIYCKFYIKKQFMVHNPSTDQQHSFDLDKTKYYLITAWGDKVSQRGPDGNVAQHLPQNSYSCEKQVRLSRQFLPTSTQVNFLQAHGVFMTIAFVFLTSVGNFIGKYYKEVFPEPSFCKMPRWHLLHFLFFILALVCIIFGILFYVVGMYGVESRVEKKWFHAVVGYFVLVMFFANFLMGFCLKSKPTERPDHLAVVHMIVAYVIQLAAYALIAEVHKIPFSSVSCVLAYMGLSWAIIYVYINIFMWVWHMRGHFHDIWVPCITGDTNDGKAKVSLVQSLTQSRISQDRMNVGPGKRVRIGALLVFSGTAFLFMVTMAAIIVWPPVGPCYVGERPLYFEEGY